MKIEMFLPDQSCGVNQNFSRTAADRLFILINQRPVGYKSVEKVSTTLLVVGVFVLSLDWLRCGHSVPAFEYLMYVFNGTVSFSCSYPEVI